MSTRRSRWALASCFTDASPPGGGRARRCARAFLSCAWLAAAAATADSACEQRQLEAELPLAETPALYLVVDRAGAGVEARVRGITLESLPLAGSELFVFQPSGEPAGAVDIEVPHVWRVDEDPPAPHRKVIEPRELRPHEGEDAAPDEAEAEGTSASPPSAPKVEVVTPPEAYRVALDEGWQLLVAQEVPGTGLWDRLVGRLRDGWARLRGRPEERPRVLALALAAADAQRLHHRLRRGTAVLLLGGCP